jgi:chromosome segregation ATPase
MANNEAGAFLNITPDVLKKLDSFDEKLEKIEKHAHTAADALKNGFGSVVIDTGKLESAITSLAKKIDAIKGNPFEGAGKGAEETTRKTISLNESLSRAADLLNRISSNKIGEGSFSNLNISGLKQGYSDLKKYVENMDLSKPQQKAAVEAMRYMKMELDEQRKTDEQRAQSAEKAAQRKEAADRRAAKAAADLANAQRSTPQGALDYSKNTKSLKENVQAIEYLKKARLSLNTTDKNYQTTLQQINQAIAKHNQALTEAGVKSQQLATRHRNLMDTAGQLSRQLALVFSVSQIEGYISKLANVRGEFELQQRSLQAILQNKSQADQIFNKTVQLAVKSPFKIKELVSYTKQLAAYRIESSKLYDTTKRLADVSAGLGVDMGRLILAYGQVKAAAYLRGTEVRQFTEAGINLYGELQRYFEEAKGEAYTTAQIVDMISKRKVTFEDIENIFKRLTESGGLFYNMQEIQAETLQGKISNLQDSIDVMLNSIGKANEDTLKGSIDSIKVLIDNWETVVEVAKTFGVVVGSLLLAPKIKAVTQGVGLLSFALTKAETSLRSLGLAFKASLPLMALGAALQLVNELWNVHSQYNKMLRESSNKYYTAQLRIGEIDEIAKNDTRKALSSLVKEMNNEGFEIEIKPNISEKEAKEQFEEYKKQYTDFLEDIRKIEANYAENRKKGWLIGNDDIETDLDEYENAFNDFIAKGNKIQAELLRISEESTSLGKGAKDYIQELVKGKKEGESLIEYYERLADYLERIKNGVLFAGKKSSIFSSFLGSRKDMEKEKESAIQEIHEIFDTINDEVIKGNKTREQFRILIDKKALDEQWSEIKKELAYNVYELGDIKVPLRPGINKEEPEPDPKHERDILAERISLIKELNKEYEKLNKVMGSKEAAKTVMERYEESLKNVNMPKSIIGDMFLPNKKNTAKALQEISKIITDFRKKQGAINDSYQLLDSDDVENIKKQLDKTKKNIEAMFNSLDLHKKLKDAGLSEAEVQQLFPGLAKTLDDVQKGIEIEFQTKYTDTYKAPNTQQYKDYQDAIKEIEQQRIKESQDLVVELTKAYKTQLSDQLQLDRWYYEERAKIQKANLTEEQRIQYEANLKSQYGRKSDENTWKQFQNSDMYISMFENIESSSTRMLTAMRDKLASLRENLKDLPADQLKAIIKQQEKIDEMISKKNPFTGLTSGVKEYIQFLKQRNELEKENIRANNAVAYYTEQKNAQSQIVQQKKQEYDAAVEIYGVDSAQANQLRIQWLLEKSKLDAILAQLVAEGKITEETAEQIRNGQKLGKTLSDKFSEIGNNLSEFSSGITDVASNLENVFGTMSAGTADTISSIAEIASGLGQTASGVARAIANPADIGGYIQAVGGIAKTIGSLFNIKDKKKEREIQRQIKNIETLGKTYDELKEKMEAAWSADDLRTQTKDTVANLDQQIASYQAMIKAEQDKKKTDKDRINEWNDAIKELEKTKQEILNQEKIEMGGIGGESEYKDAASSFVQAWLDAFNETGDGLKGLEENFDDFINNLFLKQASMRIANKFLEPLFQMIDLAVTEGEAAIAKGFDGSTDLTRQEMDKIVEEAKKQFPQLSEALEQLYNALGIKNNKTAELSSLTQSIQGITEREAEILESLLNSIRFFVSQQTTDISAIRALLDARYGLEAEYSDSNPMLVELRAQTGYLEKLSDYIGRVFAPSPNSKGPALRVIMQ